MNIILLFVNSVITCGVVCIALITGGVQDVNYWIGCILAFISGFGLRLMGDIRNKNISWLNSFVQFISSICLCLAFFIFKPLFASWMKLEYFIFFAALSSVYMIDVIEKSFKVGFFTYVRFLFTNLVTSIIENAKRNKGENL